jgi:hypothetical protein
MRRFVVGEKVCLITFKPCATCEHCKALREGAPFAPGVVSVVTSVNYETGTITVSDLPLPLKVPS